VLCNKKSGTCVYFPPRVLLFYCFQVLGKNANCLWTWDNIIGIAVEKLRSMPKGYLLF